MARKATPKFKTESQEQDFWTTHDSTEYVDWSQGKIAILPELKASTQTISLRLPESLLAALKMIANKKDVPYQSLLKIFLSERVNQELKLGQTKKILKHS